MGSKIHNVVDQKMNNPDGNMLYERCLVQIIFLIHDITISTYQKRCINVILLFIYHYLHLPFRRSVKVGFYFNLYFYVHLMWMRICTKPLMYHVYIRRSNKF